MFLRLCLFEQVSSISYSNVTVFVSHQRAPPQRSQSIYCWESEEARCVEISTLYFGERRKVTVVQRKPRDESSDLEDVSSEY